MFRGVDWAKLGFVAAYVIGEGLYEALGVFWGNDNPRFDLCLGHVGHDTHEIEDEFGVGMGDDREVGIHPLCNFFSQFDIDLIGIGGFIVFHTDVFFCFRKGAV